MTGSGAANPEGMISVGIGRWAVAAAPMKLRTLLGSCVAVILHDRIGRAGGIAHILLPEAPNSEGASRDHPGKYANTAIPGMLADLERLIAVRARIRMNAKIIGGATMFATKQTESIGERNQKAVEQILAELGIAIIARDLGGESGRRVTLDTFSGCVQVKIPGGAEYEI